MSRITYSEKNAELMRKVAEHMEGTCESLDGVLQQVFGDESLTLTDFDPELLRVLDDITQECQGCGWWVDTSDLDDEQVCSDCREGD